MRKFISRGLCEARFLGRGVIRECKGAVTVFVTLLLIPAMLVSGTAVDLARIHTARSILQDANQMASNTLLTQYNALLYDIYGLFAIAEEDPILWQLLDDYISVSVFGEESRNKALGTLQVFYGAGLSMEEVYFADDKNLRDADVLRRQIEEYMKFRGPVLIVKEFLEMLDGNTVKEDTAVINDKLSIESGIAEMFEKYKELYDAINAADKIRQINGGISGGHFGVVSSTLGDIQSEFVNLRTSYYEWLYAYDDDERAEYATKYAGILSNIRARVVSGRTNLDWRGGYRDEEGVWISGAGWRTQGNVNAGLNQSIENAKRVADEFKPKFDRVVTVAREIDAMRDRLVSIVDELERKLNSGECSDELKDALTERQGEPPKSLIERYREVLKWDNLEGMATAYKDNGYRYIDQDVKPMLDGVRYRNRDNPSAMSLSRAELAALPSDPRFSLPNNLVDIFAGFPQSSVSYPMPPGFLMFSQVTSRHAEFFAELTAMMNQQPTNPIQLFDGQEEQGGANAQEKQENMISALLKLIDSAYEGLTNNPLGARSINDSAAPAQEKLAILEIPGLIMQALGENVIGTIQDPAGSMIGAWEYLLLLTYCTSVFSNYTTARPDSIGKSRDDIGDISYPKSITGVPISPKVNYFFQSEWEYLYEGNYNAGANLSAVTRLIFMLRLVCNYIAVFTVSEITAIVSAIQAAFSWAPPLGIVLGELARAAFVAAESLFDIATLRSGHKVPLIKKYSAGEWVCSPSGVIRAISNAATEAAGGGGTENGLTYSNYMVFFFVTRAVFSRNAGAELAGRAADLIEWNIINYQNMIFSDEEKMSEAVESEGRFKLAEMKTDFSITTTVNLRMLFLSMLYSQNFADRRGTSISPTMPVKVTDYRGY